jgi:peroxiredoxin
VARLVGRPAPGFSMKNQPGQRHSLDQYLGAKNVVLMFYPYAFSSVCSGELSAVRDSIGDFVNDDVQLLAISCDPMYSLRVFADRDGLSFPLLSDFWPHGAVADAYGVFDPQLGCAARASFVIDREGIVRWAVRNQMPQARDLDDYRLALKELA